MSSIYLTEQNALVKYQHNYFKVLLNDKQCICIHARNVSQFAIFANIDLPREAIQGIRLHQIPVIYFTPEGEYLGRLENTSQLQAKYLSYQLRRVRNLDCNRATAESIIWAELHNKHTFLQNWSRYHASEATQRALNYMTLLMDNLAIAKSLNDLREYREEADNVYNYAIAALINFYNPCSRTTAKRVSKLLNLGNQLLHQYIYTCLITAGLHPNYAILHRGSDKELPLAWDFTAEFSAPIVDDLVLNFSRNMTSLNGNGNGNGKSKPRTLIQHFLQQWERKLRTFVLHPIAGEVTYRQCIDLQVREYLGSVLGDVEYYRPLALKFHPNHPNFTNPKLSKKPALTLVK